MWIYDYHYHYLNEEEQNVHVLYNSGVIVVITTMYCSLPSGSKLKICQHFQKNHSSTLWHKHTANAYGVLVDYTNVEGIPIIYRDANGVWLVNHSARQLPERELYMLLSHKKQVFLNSSTTTDT